jgi:hypothetical protein
MSLSLFLAAAKDGAPAVVLVSAEGWATRLPITCEAHLRGDDQAKKQY